jgi:hypothetical protein
MNKKGAELSISTIIILIIAIITLVIIIGFITGFLPDLLKKLGGYPIPEILPTADNPISFIPSAVQRGKDTKMTIGLYNNEQADIPDTVVPTITCQGISEVTVAAAGLNILVGETNNYRALVSVPKDTLSGQYSCSMKISSTEKTFFLEVK